MQSYTNENFLKIKNNKLFYIFKYKKIDYEFMNDFLKINFKKNYSILLYHNDNFVPQFILLDIDNVNMMTFCDNINNKIDQYDKIEDIIYEIYEYINNIIEIESIKNTNEINKDISKFINELEIEKEKFIELNKINNNNPKLFSTRAYVEMLGDQIIKIYSNKNFEIKINDFPNIKIILKNFSFKDQNDLIIIIDMKINLDIINEPPIIDITSNKILKDNILDNICHLKPFSDINFWSVKYSIYDITINIYNIIDKYGEIKKEFPNELDQIINDLEYLLYLTKKIPENKLLEIFDIDLLLNNSIIKNENNKDYWKKGTGYGHNNSKEWNIDNYIKNINEKKNNIKNKFITFINLLNINKFEKNDNILEQIINLFIIYIENEEIDNFIILTIADIINHNFNNFNKSINKKKLAKIFDSIKNYINDNDLSHSLLENIIVDDIIVKGLNNNNEFNQIFNNHKFVFYPDKFKTFYYDNSLNLNSDNIQRLKKEFNIIKKSLTINSEASIFFYVERNQLYKMKFIISGPIGTPYENGLYIFDMCLDKNFPSKPPLVHFSNNGGQRFNPNLYVCGKVCLSLLGTWRGDKGESWNSATSTFFQILISIQSQILIDEPYFNEPGYESYIGKSNGILNSKKYNIKIRQYNLDYAINLLIDNIISENNSYIEFESIIRNYFKIKKNSILEMLEKWEKDLILDSDSYKKFKFSKEKFINIVDKL